jgi:hypothetical protein
MTINADAQDASPVTLAAARAEFDAAVTYLDTATFGLPPRRSWAALQQALAQWRAGTAGAVAYDLPLAAARSSYAHLAGVDSSVVAVGSQVSVFAGLIAANLPNGSEVLTATSAQAGQQPSARDWIPLLICKNFVELRGFEPLTPPCHIAAGRSIEVICAGRKADGG